MSAVPRLDLGSFDGVVALNCLYYLEEAEIEEVMTWAFDNAEFFLIQCNTRDQGHLGRRPTPQYMADALKRVGWPLVTVDQPWDHLRRGIIPQRYHRPVVVGRKRLESDPWARQA